MTEEQIQKRIREFNEGYKMGIEKTLQKIRDLQKQLHKGTASYQVLQELKKQIKEKRR